ncbi:MAG TPA: hypothetical protein VIY08_03200 [Candidatus Nitrosocosmicus sp.]
MKKYRILVDVFWNKLRKYVKVSDTVVGLVKFRIMDYHSRTKINTKFMGLV